MKKVCVVIVNYNGLKYNEDCINSILNSDYNGIEVVVVDNSSIDDSVEQLRKVFKEKITIIENKTNGGFAYGTNLGIEYAMKCNFDYILLLNNDTIIEKDMVNELIECSSNNDNCVVAPKILYFEPNDRIWFAGGDICWKKGSTIHYGMNERNNEKYSELKKINFATGCCILLPREVIEQVGVLTEGYFLYYEDVDYCMKIREGGFNILYNPKAVMYHRVSASTGGEEGRCFVYYFTRARLYFNKKYNKYKIQYISYFAMGSIRKYFIWLLKGRVDLIKCSVNAIFDVLRGVEGKNDKY